MCPQPVKLCFFYPFKLIFIISYVDSCIMSCSSNFTRTNYFGCTSVVIVFWQNTGGEDSRMVGWLLLPCFIRPAVLVNQQVWRGSTSVGRDRQSESRDRERLQWARWPSARDWRIDLSPESNLEDGHNPGLMIVVRVSRCHRCDKEEGGATERWALKGALSVKSVF